MCFSIFVKFIRIVSHEATKRKSVTMKTLTYKRSQIRHALHKMLAHKTPCISVLQYVLLLSATFLLFTCAREDILGKYENPASTSTRNTNLSWVLMFQDDFDRPDISQNIGNDWTNVYSKYECNLRGAVSAGVYSNLYKVGQANQATNPGLVATARVVGRAFRNKESYTAEIFPYQITFLFKPYYSTALNNYGQGGYLKVLVCNTDMESTGAVNGIGFGLLFADYAYDDPGTGEGANEIEIYNTGVIEKTGSFTYTSDTWYNVKAVIDKNSVKVKIWTGIEPESWSIEKNDITSFSASGSNLYIGFHTSVGSTNSGATVKAEINNLMVYQGIMQ